MSKKFAIVCLSAFALTILAQTTNADCPRCPKQAVVVNSGVDGQALHHVLQGIVPLKPVPSVPIAGIDIIAKDAVTGKEIARAKTDKDGKYRLALPKGNYKLEAKYGSNWTYSQDVKVLASKWVNLKSNFKHDGNGPLPPSAPPGNAKGAVSGSGVSGETLQYPVFGNPPTFPVPPSPVAGVEIIATDAKTGKEVARAKTDKDGKFSLNLAAGEYKLQSQNGKNFTYSETIKVTANTWAKVKAVFRYVGPPVPSPGGPVRR